MSRQAVNSDTPNCPACGMDWVAGEIPAADRHHFGNKTHFSRVIYINTLRDGPNFYQCPECVERFNIKPSPSAEPTKEPR